MEVEEVDHRLMEVDTVLVVLEVEEQVHGAVLVELPILEVEEVDQARVLEQVELVAQV
jgi:hypothetical protein